MKHKLESYLNCIPPVDVDRLERYLTEDKDVWKTYFLVAESRANKVAAGYEELLDKHRKELEEYLKKTGGRRRKIYSN